MAYLKKFTSAACLPVKSTIGSCGYDLFSSSDVLVRPGESVSVATDIGVLLPPGVAGVILGRSGMFAKHKLMVFNGLIDRDFTGKIVVMLINFSTESYSIKFGMRIAQLLFVSTYDGSVSETETLPISERGEGGLGSTGY